MTTAIERVELVDPDSFQDLATYLARARRVDPEGAARLVAEAGVLAAYVSPVHGPGAPTVLGLRALALVDADLSLDVTVPLAALGDRFAAAAADSVSLPLPPNRASGASWAGVSPPRTGWELRTALDPAELSRVAREGVQEIAAALPEAVGGHVVAQVRSAIWGRHLPSAPGVAAGAAYAADALGFLDPHEPVAVRQAGPWWRLSTSRGHVLARAKLL